MKRSVGECPDGLEDALGLFQVAGDWARAGIVQEPRKMQALLLRNYLQLEIPRIRANYNINIGSLTSVFGYAGRRPDGSEPARIASYTKTRNGWNTFVTASRCVPARPTIFGNPVAHENPCQTRLAS